MAVQNVANVLMGPATIYAGAQGVITAAPALASVNSTPAASAWTDLGGTDGGLTFEVAPKFSDLSVDQVVDLLGQRLTSRTITATTTLSEATLANLALALNTTVGATGANYATSEPNYGQFATQVPYISLLVDGWAPASVVANARRRIYFPRVLSTGKISIVYAKDKQVGYSVQFQAFYASGSVAPFTIVDQTA
jgi:hypothetical protein